MTYRTILGWWGREEVWRDPQLAVLASLVPPIWASRKMELALPQGYTHLLKVLSSS